jgi:hypothetical protein
VIKSLTLGKTHLKSGDQSSPMDEYGGDNSWPDGRYVQVSGATDSVAVISDPLTDVTPDASHWLAKDFFRVTKPKTISVTFPDATNSWSLSRETETGEWKLAAARAEEQLDSSKTASVTSPFASPSLNDVALGLTAEQSGLDHPTTITIGTFDGFEYTVTVGNKVKENYLVQVAVTGNFPAERKAAADEKPEDKAKLDKEFADARKKLEEKLATESAFSKWTYEVAGWTVDPLLKKRGELLAEKPAPPAETESDTNAPAAGL